MKPEDVAVWIAVGVGIIIVIAIIAGKPVEIEVVVTFGPSWVRSCYPDGKCILTLYSGVRHVFEDNVWKSIENARSLKGYYKVVYLEKDPNYEIEIDDFNLTYIKKIKVKSKKAGDIPFKLNNVEHKKLKFKEGEELELEDVNVPNGILAYNFTLGSDSTTIMLQDADTENLDDSFGNSALGEDNERGACVEIFIGGEPSRFGILKFNISQIPSGQTIDEAKFSLYATAEGIDTGEELSFNTHHVYTFPDFNVSNEEWVEGNDTDCFTGDTAVAPEISYNTFPTTAEEMNLTTESSLTFDASAATSTWYTWTVTQMVSREYNNENKNITILMNVTLISGTPSGSDDVDFDSKEGATSSQRPYLNITYSAAVVDTCTPGASVWNMDCADNCTKSNEIINVAGDWNIYGTGGIFFCNQCGISMYNLTMNATNCDLIFKGPFNITIQG